MLAAGIAGVVEQLESIRDTVLRIVKFVAQGREAGNSNEAQTKIARIAGEFRKTHQLVDTSLHVLLKSPGSHPVKSQARFVDQCRSKNVGLTYDQVLGPARNLSPKAGQSGKTRTGERLKKVPVPEAVSESPGRGRVEGVVHPNIKAIISIPQRRRGNKILKRYRTVGKRIQCGNLDPDRA